MRRIIVMHFANLTVINKVKWIFVYRITKLETGSISMRKTIRHPPSAIRHETVEVIQKPNCGRLFVAIFRILYVYACVCTFVCRYKLICNAAAVNFRIIFFNHFKMFATGLITNDP